MGRITVQHFWEYQQLNASARVLELDKRHHLPASGGFQPFAVHDRRHIDAVPVVDAASALLRCGHIRNQGALVSADHLLKPSHRMPADIKPGGFLLHRQQAGGVIFLHLRQRISILRRKGWVVKQGDLPCNIVFVGGVNIVDQRFVSLKHLTPVAAYAVERA